MSHRIISLRLGESNGLLPKIGSPTSRSDLAARIATINRGLVELHLSIADADIGWHKIAHFQMNEIAGHQLFWNQPLLPIAHDSCSDGKPLLQKL